MTTDEKLPPFNAAAEEAVLASLMVDDEAPDRVNGIVYAEDFYRDQNRWTFDVCRELHAAAGPVNQVTVADALARSNRLDDVGGLLFLARLTTQLVTPVGVEHYAAIVHRDAMYRRLISAASEMVRLAYEAAPDIDATLGRCETLLQEVSDRKTDDGPVPVSQAIDEFWAAGGVETPDTIAVRCGYPKLDEKLAGLKRGALITVASRTSVGKSAFVLNLIRNAAYAQNLRGLLFSLEMDSSELAVRLLAGESGIDAMRLKMGMREDEERLVMQGTAALFHLPIYLDDSGRSTIDRIRTVARRHKARHGLDLVVVDYLQLVGGTGKHRENRVQEVGEVSGGLKRLARELNVPVVAAAQLSRAVEYRKGKDREPRLSDLRESGSVEQDSDVVLFLHPQETPADHVKVIVAKNRGGPRGWCMLRHDAATSRFEALIERDGDAEYQVPGWAR